MILCDFDLLKIKTNIGYNNKILVSDGKFSLGKNDKVNAGSANALNLISAKISQKIKSRKVVAQMTTTHKD